PQAIADAKENAKRNRITNARFFVGAAEEVLPAYYRERRTDSSCHPDVIVVDPPRKGCDIACLETMVQMQPQRIVYVSCDPATLARDIKYLREQGYKLQRVRACDMFPNSFHVETVVRLQRTDT
ncbi:MAG: class I SAM-dependent RNA methyltransferase, partial [Lachnospiraceae bacterium]|nr:class I SAM-dependent RNA methyltransferase [Lachnospiraceae bacterium]